MARLWRLMFINVAGAVFILLLELVGWQKATRPPRRRRSRRAHILILPVSPLSPRVCAMGRCLLSPDLSCGALIPLSRRDNFLEACSA